jgi:dTDP-D-glucose 4,6-dehydratase
VVRRFLTSFRSKPRRFACLYAQDAIDANKILSPDEINWDEEIKYDPGLRKEIDAYHPNLREKVRRKGHKYDL